MPFNPEIFRSYDIRGIVPDEFDPEEAYHIGRAYVAHTGAKKVVVARDMRLTSPEIEEHLVSGLTDAGVDVIKIGQATTPLFYFAVEHFGVDGGLSVTASHNPGEYNGIKITREYAIPVGGDTGLMDIRDLAEKRNWPEVEAKGTVTEDSSALEPYLETVCENGLAEGLKIVVDAGNGMVGMLLKDVFSRLGGDVVDLYWEPDGSFPNHEADPLKEENMVDLKKAVLESQADLGVAFDGDGDRAFFVDETGETVPGDFTTALIAQSVLQAHPGAKILYDLRASRVVKEIIEAAGGTTAMSKVGHSNIKAQMREENAVFAGEVSGHFYFSQVDLFPESKDEFYADSALLAFVRVLQTMKAEGKKLSQLTEPLKKYAKTTEINFTVGDKEKVLAALKEKFADAEILELDGISIIYPDWWANVRASNTEPKLRLNMEADNAELLAAKQAAVEEIITS